MFKVHFFFFLQGNEDQPVQAKFRFLKLVASDVVALLNFVSR